MSNEGPSVQHSEPTLRPPVRPPSRPESPVPFRPVPSSRRVSKMLIEPLLKRPDRIRNVCILAHVDHGKTTLTDSLLASNGIISFKQAGTLRYMDAREDEQERGITMESSAVSLLFDLRTDLVSAGAASSTSLSTVQSEDMNGVCKSLESLSIGDRRFLVNLIDSPGHVDFSSQVATAAKLCDGCLVLVDAVEGVCTQTAAVLRQAHRDRLTPCLVVNKMDRLATELKLSSTEAAEWLMKLLAQVNAIQATVSRDLNVEEVTEAVNADDEEASIERLASVGPACGDDQVFSPSRGNVIFASATDGWAFRVDQFARLHAKRLEMKEEVLQQTLWGEYYWDQKGRRVVGRKGADKLGLSKPLFAQLILDNIWPVYEATSKDTWDQARIERIANGLHVRLPLRELKARDGRTVLRSIMTSWLPLAETAFAAIVDQLPDPIAAARIRIPALLPSVDPGLPEASSALIRKLSGADSSVGWEEEPMVAYLSKQFAVTIKSEGGDEDDSQPQEKLIGMARVFHGTLRVGQRIHVLQPKWHPSAPEEHRTEVTVRELFLLMGRDLEPVDAVYSGNVFGIGGLEESVGKSATLSSTLASPSFDASLSHKTAPIVRVALHPVNLSQMDQLVAGLHLLCQADPCAEMQLQPETGEYILAAAGELHLEQCLKDLRERYTHIAIEASPPMVPFRETISSQPAISLSQWNSGLDEGKGEGASADGCVRLCTPNGRLRIGIRAIPLQSALTDYLMTHRRGLRALGLDSQPASPLDKAEALHSLITAQGLDPDGLLALGPRRLGPNMLLADQKIRQGGQYFQCLSSILSGFQVATEQGPLCSEPLMGVAFVLESIELTNPEDGPEALCGATCGQLISTTKDCCHRAFLFRSPRLLLATYSCDIQATAEVLGRVYSVVARRSGTILAEEYNDGTGFFTVRALVPVIESFGFADDIRGRTSGLAIPQLLFHGFRLLDQDPFWVPSTEEELEDFGETAEKENVAMRYLIGVRERKGLFVEKKLVQSAEKQRTLKK